MSEYQTEVDAIQAIDEQIEALNRLREERVHNLAALLLDKGEKEALGSNGTGFALTSTTKYQYGKPAYAYLEEKGLLGQFVAEPKVTKTKLDALLKEGALNYADMAELERFTTIEQSPYSLRKVTPKAAKVFA